MGLLHRDDWYDIARDVAWTLSYVHETEAFPEVWTGTQVIPREAWKAWDEPYRVSYRANLVEKLHPAHIGASVLHMGTTCMVEQMAVTMQAHFCHFAPSPRWRNLGVFGMLDEIRYTQLDLAFSHDLLKYDPRYDWCQKGFHTNEWGIIAVRHFFDDWMLNANCVDAAIATSLTVEHGFTNLQFVALAADAMAVGDVDFSNLLSSIQTDEARHAQQGFPTLEVLMKHEPQRAQQVFDIAFWRSFRLFQTLTGPAMDYYTPLVRRKMSFKEFMMERVVTQHERTMRDYGLQTP